ncbi:NAD(P)/FAD-dependent oxidoreductase [Frondihabitans australicus]|uniref:Thioredoxin reductase n=1 Tax=Frondihabitans australicus TaxID=386892 RepID=A0A495IMH6_9MICO|nr:NAD(P)/FAD-dependent oxidoreductase [Frondihabitans australicus]RKR76638.1 thioredoxin reductase [Frondihabitans australicus]
MTENSAQPGLLDVVVIGGGAAGLSAALTLARARRSVVVVDDGTPRNARASGVHGFLSRDGIDPRELLDLGRDEVRRYGGVVLDGRVDDVRRGGPVRAAIPESGAATPAPTFEVVLGDTRILQCRRVLVASGLADELPDVEGLAERFGRDVVHCPYCHGWEVRERPIAVLGTTPFAVHQALLFSQWSDEVALVVSDPAAAPSPAELTRLQARRIRVVAGRARRVVVAVDAVTGVELDSGEVVPAAAIAVTTSTRARSSLVDALGVEVAAHPVSGAPRIIADPMGRTSVPGVWAAGNVVDPMLQVVAAAAAGVGAAAMLNMDLIEEETDAAVAALAARA